MLMHTLRPDGFDYLESSGGPSYLRTRSMLVEGDGLSFNVQISMARWRLRLGRRAVR